MFQVAEAIATSDKDQSYGLPDISLEHQILREIDIGPPWPLPTWDQLLVTAVPFDNEHPIQNTGIWGSILIFI